MRAPASIKARALSRTPSSSATGAPPRRTLRTACSYTLAQAWLKTPSAWAHCSCVLPFPQTAGSRAATRPGRQYWAPEIRVSPAEPGAARTARRSRALTRS
ncbi:MAG: hypothetical protein M0D55_09030 [Elusimicrobiota bacterium]|nr:MAG: hypothetical protein M0D55_09030 [Elusimicrobiota bacterium]